MSTTDGPSTNTLFAIPDEVPVTIVQTQHGMRFPDGTVNWEHAYEIGSGRKINWATIAKGDLDQGTMGRWWLDHLQRKAEAVHIDVTDYINSHQPIKRMVVVAVTEAEDA